MPSCFLFCYPYSFHCMLNLFMLTSMPAYLIFHFVSGCISFIHKRYLNGILSTTAIFCILTAHCIFFSVSYTVLCFCLKLGIEPAHQLYVAPQMLHRVAQGKWTLLVQPEPLVASMPARHTNIACHYESEQSFFCFRGNYPLLWNLMIVCM